MATNTRNGLGRTDCSHDGAVLGDRTCREDPLACELAEALELAEEPAVKFHLRQALQLRLAEDLRPPRSR